MAEAQVNGVRLYYEEHGEGEPILCIHGTSSSAMIWRSAVEELSTLGRMIVYDRRGCTRSERPEPYETNVAQHVEDAAALLGELEAAPAVVIGRSYGGQVALGLALAHPGSISALVLLEGVPETLDEEAAAWGRELEAVVERAAAEEVSSVAETFLRRVLGDEQWESFPARTKEMFTANSPAILAELRGGPLRATAEDLAGVEVPTLLVAAETSPPAFRRTAKVAAEAIPDARLTLVGGGHLIDPAGPEVLAFVREILAR